MISITDDVRLFEHMYFSQEVMFLENANDSFWKMWCSFNMGETVMQRYGEAMKTKMFDTSSMTLGFRQIQERFIRFMFEFEEIPRLSVRDLVTLLRGNLYKGPPLFTLWLCSLQDQNIQEKYSMGSLDQRFCEVNGIHKISLNSVVACMPQAVKDVVSKALLPYLKDPKIFYLMSGIIMFDDVTPNLQAVDVVRQIRKELITILRNHLNRNFPSFDEQAFQGVFSCISSSLELAKYFNF